jgi:hypothetical protein
MSANLQMIYEFMKKILRSNKADLETGERKSNEENNEQSIAIDNENFILKNQNSANKNNNSLSSINNKDLDDENYGVNFHNNILFFKTLNEINEKISNNFYNKCGDNKFPKPIPE